MYSPICLLLLFFTTFIGNVATAHVETRELTIVDIPPCGLECLLLTVPASGCSLTDVECQCKNVQLTYSTAACMLANCTMDDSLGTAKVQAHLCNLSNESQSHTAFVSFTIVYTILCVCVALRLATKLLTKRVRVDDYVILLTFFLTTAVYACGCAMVNNGFGKHLWNLESGQLKAALKYFYVCWNLYVIILALVKASLIAFYLQIFQSRRFRNTCYVVLGYIALSATVIQFLTIFSCIPVQSFWDRDIKGKCLNVNAIGYANSANAIIQDLIVLFLPMPILYKLKMKRWRKIGVSLMFAVGAFGCVTTMIRLRTLLHFSISIDPTWDYTAVSIWTAAELASGIVCASLPAIRQLLNMTLPKGFLALLTSRSQSRSTPVPARASSPSAERKRKGRSVFPLHSFSEKTSSSFGTKTDISSCTMSKSDSQVLPERETDIAQHEARKTFQWLPLGSLFQNKSRSFQTSFWSSVDRAGSPPLTPRLTQQAANSTELRDVSSESDRVYCTETESLTGPQSTLLKPPQAHHRSNGRDTIYGTDITALPNIGLLPDVEYPSSDPAQNWRSKR